MRSFDVRESVKVFTRNGMELREFRALGDLEIDPRDEVHRVLVGRSACCGGVLAELAVVLVDLYREVHKSDHHSDSADEVADVPKCVEDGFSPAA